MSGLLNLQAQKSENSRDPPVASGSRHFCHSFPLISDFLPVRRWCLKARGQSSQQPSGSRLVYAEASNLLLEGPKETDQTRPSGSTMSKPLVISGKNEVI